MADTTIWKFALEITDHQVVSIPMPAIILTAAATGPNQLSLWAIVDPDSPVNRDVALELRGTGHPLEPVGSYLATIIDSPFVWHLFQSRPETSPGEGSDRA